MSAGGVPAHGAGRPARWWRAGDLVSAAARRSP